MQIILDNPDIEIRIDLAPRQRGAIEVYDGNRLAMTYDHRPEGVAYGTSAALMPLQGLVPVDDPLYAALIPLMAPRSGHWSKVRAEHIEREPACQVCGTKSNLNVHHIFPYHIWPQYELDQRNLITFCQPHHLLIGHKMDWKSFNLHAREEARKLNTEIQARGYVKPAGMTLEMVENILRVVT